MVNVAREMKLRGMNIPLLIGGATTSKTHTAVKISPQYSSNAPVVYVLDASRSVGTVSSLLDKRTNKEFAQEILSEYETITKDYFATHAKALISYDRCKQLKPKIDFVDIKKPNFFGVRKIEYTVSQLIDTIDWNPFFAVYCSFLLY